MNQGFQNKEESEMKIKLSGETNSKNANILLKKKVSLYEFRLDIIKYHLYFLYI